MFEDEYRVATRPVPKVELVLSDASLLLPPTVTPLTGNVLYLFLTASYNALAVEGIVLKIKMATKGQLISKADWRAIDSPKKRMDEHVLFPF